MGLAIDHVLTRTNGDAPWSRDGQRQSQSSMSSCINISQNLYTSGRPSTVRAEGRLSASAWSRRMCSARCRPSCGWSSHKGDNRHGLEPRPW